MDSYQRAFDPNLNDAEYWDRLNLMKRHEIWEPVIRSTNVNIRFWPTRCWLHHQWRWKFPQFMRPRIERGGKVKESLTEGLLPRSGRMRYMPFLVHGPLYIHISHLRSSYFNLYEFYFFYLINFLRHPFGLHSESTDWPSLCWLVYFKSFCIR